ncbi:CDP-diacylglycerol--serine O-phosphatidyltransferase [Corallococcus exiguus]|uniref:CDP-diacylglycerol--serine O-phosphatidyltransferase n=1 Tax=Corallococcus exiguus TaxID=83462 RepID=A0A7X4Y763_9BACT|nr:MULTISPECIES: CDP-diacylglycerol--serine O-phosphatidyltransferase [Corallococcus]NBC39409.1 CDP-diacylglycerol--serine O-phosphatidyltransferase [Corallococcus exiguus]NNC18858.1 CDP-diacylglycerol--serine O-phosphatidyltransferase [Corallococcus exiguus]NRD58142.1 CDP-diacylglycerol--serine O-phosphatidyltransferase [Corallococcus exiguus]RKH28289.1 CDP-diacylglycerol--serine O-phosphatidyltransferase [Corallococcus sp. CA041A]RKI08054.1 CDP-diacylglycerol--serine O-phosphatidyltransferas
MKLRKLMFVLPNLFTVTSIFCGFYAITLCSGEAEPVQLYQAALAILFAMFFDGFDGRVARLTKTQSDFGMQLDSLADVMSFGAAPALLVYKWALAPMGFWGLFISFAFMACGAMRLARFNVLAMRNPHGGGGGFFVGLPIPLAAGVLVSLIISHHVASQGEALGDGARLPVAVAVGALSLLMVSTVRYRTFKDARPSRKTALVFMVMALTGAFIAQQFHPAWVLVTYFAAYLVMGLVESAVSVRSRLASRKVGAVAAVAVAAGLDEDDDEDSEANATDDGPAFL